MHTRKSMAELQKFPIYMDVDVLGSCERMIFEVFYVSVPATAENFRTLCEGSERMDPITNRCLWYIRCYFHQVGKDSSYVMGGSLSKDTEEYMGNLYGQNFPDESNDMKHDKEGLLSMSKRDQKAGSSKFLITLKADQSLDSSHVVFGKLVAGLTTLRRIGKICFKWPVQIVDCAVDLCGLVPHGVKLLADEDSDPMTPERTVLVWASEEEIGKSYPHIPEASLLWEDPDRLWGEFNSDPEALLREKTLLCSKCKASLV